MNSPSFELPSGPPLAPPPVKTETRNYLGWFLLLVIFTYLIGSELVDYLDRREPTATSKYSASAAQLKMGVQLKQSFGNFGSKGSSDLASPIREVEDDLAKDAPKDATAARIYSAARSEQGKDIPAPVLAQLNSSKEPKDKLFAEIFSAKKLTKERAAELEVKLKGGGFISKLATIQAYDKAGDSTKRDELVSRGRSYAQIGVMVLALGAGGIGFVLLLICLALKLGKQLPRKGLPLENISLADADRLAIRTAQILAIFMAVPLILREVGIGAIGRYPASLLMSVLLIVGVLYIFRFPINGKTFSLASIGITKHNLGKNIAWGFGMALANLPLVLLMSLLGTWIFSGLPKPEHPITSEIATGGMGILGLVATLVAASICAPIIEEVMFRGALLPALSRILKAPIIAILLQGLIFAAIHPTGIPAWFALGTIGAMSGFLSRQTGSLVPSIVMHAVHNLGTMMIAFTILS